MMLSQVSKLQKENSHAALHLQLHERIVELRSRLILVEMIPQIFCNLNCFILRQLGRVGNVQDHPTQFRMRWLLVPATGTAVVVVASALRPATVVAASGSVMIRVFIICEIVLAPSRIAGGGRRSSM